MFLNLSGFLKALRLLSWCKSPQGQVVRGTGGGKTNFLPNFAEGQSTLWRSINTLTWPGCFFFLSQIINFYMNLLMERSKEKGLPAVHAFNTFFFTKLKTAGYQAVKRWTKKVDVFSVDLLLVPIHLGVHWCLAVSALVIPGRASYKPTRLRLKYRGF